MPYRLLNLAVIAMLLHIQGLCNHVCMLQMAGGVLDGGAQERLPSSSTCINLLKMPPYKSTELLRSKLLFAIRNVAGFDLS